MNHTVSVEFLFEFKTFENMNENADSVEFFWQTYHEVIDEIYYKVDHLEPWERGSRKTSGQTGMCGGVRGVGAGGKAIQLGDFLYFDEGI